MLQYSCQKNPTPWQRSLAGHSLQGCKESDTTKVTQHADAQDLFACGISASVRVESEGGAAAWLWGPWWHQLCRDTDCLCCRSYGPIRIIFWNSGQSLSVVLPILAFRELPCCRELAYCILSAALFTASSFRIWNSSTRILSLLGASVRHSAGGKGHEEGGSAHAKAGSSLRSPPGNSWASTPQTRVCLLSALCSHLHLWLYRGLSPSTSLWKKELAYSSS